MTRPPRMGYPLPPMPELPLLEVGRRDLERHLAGRIITGVATVNDTIVYEGVTPRRFAAALRGRKVLSAHRRGKHLWLELDTRPWPTFHYGMGGRFHILEPGEPRPKHWKVELTAADGTRLAMTNARRLGRIRLLRDPAGEPPISRLGDDPLLALPPAKVLESRLRARRGPIKAVLLDQAFLAGIGNWIADEVLYQARLSPTRRGCDLSPTEVGRLRSCLRRIIGRAVAVDAESARFPRTWLFHHRWGKNPEARTARGETVRFLTVGGRTTAWVPDRQG